MCDPIHSPPYTPLLFSIKRHLLALNGSPWLLILTEKCSAGGGEVITCLASQGPHLPYVPEQKFSFATYLERAGEGKHLSTSVLASQDPSIPTSAIAQDQMPLTRQVIAG